MQCLLLCGAGDGDGRGGVRDALGVGADVGGGDGACDGRVAAVASALGAVCGRAVGAVLGGRDRPGRGAALRAGAAGWLLTGAGGRAAPACWWPCGTAARYTAVDVAAATVAAVPNAAQWTRRTRPAPRSQRRPAAITRPRDGTGSMADRQRGRREARSATRTAARWRSGGSASDT